MIRFSLKVDINVVPGIDDAAINAFAARLREWMETMPESMGVTVDSVNTTAIPTRNCGYVELGGTAEIVRPSTIFPLLSHESDIKIHVAYRLKDRKAWQNWIGTEENPEIAAQMFRGLLLYKAKSYEIRVHCLDDEYVQRFQNQLERLNGG